MQCVWGKGINSLATRLRRTVLRTGESVIRALRPKDASAVRRVAREFIPLHLHRLTRKNEPFARYSRLIGNKRLLFRRYIQEGRCKPMSPPLPFALTLTRSRRLTPTIRHNETSGWKRCIAKISTMTLHTLFFFYLFSSFILHPCLGVPIHQPSCIIGKSIVARWLRTYPNRRGICVCKTLVLSCRVFSIPGLLG